MSSMKLLSLAAGIVIVAGSLSSEMISPAFACANGVSGANQQPQSAQQIGSNRVTPLEPQWVPERDPGD
jgi:hypothetical protein